MTEPKFTPGPWGKVHDHPNEVTRRSLAHIKAIGRSGYNEIASVFGCYDAEQNANAHLIAAAPEMYQALVEASELIQGDKVGKEWKRACADFLATSKAALAKAEGGEA